MDELIDTIRVATNEMSEMADKLSQVGQPDLCAQMDGLVEKLQAALRQTVELKIEIKGLAEAQPVVKSPIALKHELDQVAARMRKLKETMRQPDR